MDLRFLDEITVFMNHDNLANRYDHVILAGSAFGALGAPGGKDEHGKPLEMPHWKETFFNHLSAAITLHNVSDVYILQHRNCGAFHKFFHITKDYTNSDQDQLDEKNEHLNYAKQLEMEIKSWAKSRSPNVNLCVHRFLMELRGNVVDLN
jgi:hypothetical protein